MQTWLQDYNDTFARQLQNYARSGDVLLAVSVEGCVSTYWHDLWKKTEPKNENFPRSTIARYAFPARGSMPEPNLTWWDGEKMEVTNDKEANAAVRRPYREGWTLWGRKP